MSTTLQLQALLDGYVNRKTIRENMQKSAKHNEQITAMVTHGLIGLCDDGEYQLTDGGKMLVQVLQNTRWPIEGWVMP